MSDIPSRLSVALTDRYLLERELGQGGMATVYLAKDRKHHRMVAVKVLRPELAATLGPGRFLHEIEIAAGLQHPHILALLDSGEADGFLYYVMPYIEGESLRERLDRKGEFPVSAGVRILAEIAEALAYAHSRGVVHRDMKPENVMLSGRHPLVMDFGIAKALSPAAGSQRPTTAGVALGTPTYMAPEQAAADPHLDHRVDIYALGVLGYELLTGSTPFTGTSAQQILAAHMTQKPESISVRRPAVPPGLAAILMQCLEKRPADRPQSAEELVRAFEALVTPSEGLTPSQGLTPTDTRPVPALGRAISPRTLLTAGTILVVAIAGFLWQAQAVRSRPALARHSQLTFVGNIERQEISPDGQFLAYIEGGEPARLFLKDLTGGSVIPIAKLGRWRWTLRWSPDGSSLLYSGHDSTGHVVSVLFPRLGGTPRRIAHAGAFAVLSPDGSRLAGWSQNSEPPILVKTLATGAIQKINMPERFGWRDAGDWSPDGRSIALASGTMTGSRWRLWIVEVETGRWQEVVSDSVPLSPPRWSPSGGALYYLRGHNELRGIRVTPSGTPRGAPEILQARLGATHFSLTTDGRAAYTKKQGYSNLWLAAYSPQRARFSTLQLTRGTAPKIGGRFSPDGSMIAFIQQNQDRGDVFVLPREGGEPRRITAGSIARTHAFEPTSPLGVAWSQDGQQLAFVTTTQGKNRLQTVALSGGRERIYEHTEVSEDLELAWAPHNRILYQRPGNRNFNWLDPATGGEEPLVDNDSVGWMFSPTPSPDKQRIAVLWNRKPRMEVYVISLRDSSQNQIGHNEVLGWSADGNAVYVEDSLHQIRRVSILGGPGVMIAPKPWSNASCELNEEPGRLALVCNVEESISDVWMIENFDPASR